MLDLKDLHDKREEILKAELAAWLHDVGKCADSFLQPDGMGFNAQNCRGQPRVNPHKAVFSPQELAQLSYWNSLSQNRGQCARREEANHPTALWKTLNQVNAQIPSLNVALNGCGEGSLRELILWGRPLVSERYSQFQNVLGHRLTYLAGILGKSHGASHMEKEDIADGGQSSGYVSPFGWYIKDYIKDFVNLNDKLKTIIHESSEFLRKRRDVIRYFRANMQEAPGDTRRPINEVTLWDWSSIVAALYKAEIARCVLTGEQREPNNVQWRLLSIRTDGLGYLLSANSIPDLLARKDLLTDVWNRVQTLLEETYPLGLEVHRDENGPVFVVPDIEGLLGLTDSDHNHKTLREFILEAFRQGTVKKDPCLALAGEIVPHFKLDEDAWDGQSKLPPIGKDHLKETPSLQTDPQWVARQWCNLPKPQEVCTVCGLRPQGPGKKARDRKMCDVCEKRREERAKEWAANIGRAFLSTIWLDEVADKNGRLALIVGTFDLTHWLDGTLVRSLAVRTPNDQNGHTAEDVAKNPSFARLRRIWETTRRFWEETLKEAKGKLTPRSRIFLQGTVQGNDLGPYHAYELEIQGRKVAVLWVPEQDDEVDIPEKYRGGFWVIENLDYLDNVYGRSFQNLVQDLVGQSLKVYEPTEYGRPGETRATFTISADDGVQLVENAYLPLIPILAEPRTFMALVPAASAFDVLRAIKAKYEREMGKVRNRLPLHLGVVFANAHQPLRTILDAGRRMLKQRAPALLWEVHNIKRFGQPNDPNETKKGWRALRLLKQQDLLVHHPNQFRVMVGVHLRNNGRELIWHIPAIMGDGQTEDHWYPYVFWVQDKEGNTEPANATKKRDRYYQAPNPFDMDDAGNPQPAWLVHAADLQPGDRVYFTPATFDFQWLDHGGRRFEIAYDEHGHRRGTLHRPYLLDELPNLERCWALLDRGLGARQLHQVRDLIETRRAQWFPDDPNRSLSAPTFRQFCAAVLRNAEWHTPPPETNMKCLIQWAVDGTLADAVELFYHIMKKSREDTERAEETP